jgi:hypothetical protein
MRVRAAERITSDRLAVLKIRDLTVSIWPEGVSTGQRTSDMLGRDIIVSD